MMKRIYHSFIISFCSFLKIPVSKTYHTKLFVIASTLIHTVELGYNDHGYKEFTAITAISFCSTGIKNVSHKIIWYR